MKKIINKVFILFALSVFLGSCDDVDTTEMNSAATTVVTLSESDVVLQDINVGKDALTVTWTQPDFGYNAAATYEVLFDIAGGDFSNAQVVSADGDTFSITLETEQFNNILFNLGVDPEVPTGVIVQVRALLLPGNTVSVDSEIHSLMVTAYGSPIDPFSLRNMFQVGDGTAAGWNPNLNNTPMFRSPDNEDAYTFTGYYLGANLKFVEIKGQWAPQWGTNDDGATMFRRATEDDPDPGAFVIPADGYYTVSFDLSDLSTFSMVAYDASGDDTYETIGILGDATPDGWDTDMDMTKSDFDPHIWYINGVTLTNGEMKFRADNAWDVDWGSNTPISGTGTQGGSNIPVSVAGTYDIWFNDITGNYIFIPIK